MEKLELTEEVKNYLEANKPLRVGNWTADCWGKRFKVNNNGIKLGNNIEVDPNNY